MVRLSSAGYVKQHRIIEEWADDVGLYHVRIEAWVHPRQVRDGVADELRSNESVIVLIDEDIDGEPIEPPVVASRLSEELVAAGFRVIDHTHAGLLRERDRALAAARGDQLAAQQIGMRFLAGVIITGTARARFSQDNAGIISSMGAASIRAVESDTAETIAMASLRQVKGFALDERQAGERALMAVAEQIIGDEDLLTQLGVYAGRTRREMTIDVTGLADRTAATRFTNLLGALRWVQEPVCEQFAPDLSHFTCTYAQPTVFLATRIDRRPEFAVEQYSRNRIVVRALPVEGGDDQ